MDDRTTATMNVITPKDRELAIVLAAVKVDALARRPVGRP